MRTSLCRAAPTCCFTRIALLCFVLPLLVLVFLATAVSLVPIVLDGSLTHVAVENDADILPLRRALVERCFNWMQSTILLY